MSCIKRNPGLEVGEAEGEQGGDGGEDEGLLFAVEDYLDVAVEVLVFEECLAACPAGTYGGVLEIVFPGEPFGQMQRRPGSYGYLLHGYSRMRRRGIKCRCAFGANSRRIGGILLVGTCHYRAVGKEYGSPYPKPRIRGIGGTRGIFGGIYKAAVVG